MNDLPKIEANYYIVIPAPVWNDNKLSPISKLLYGHIAIKCNIKGFCWATNNFFGEILNCNERSIQRYLKELIDSLHIRTEMNKNDNGTLRKIFISTTSIFSEESGVTNLSVTGDKSVQNRGDKSVVHNNTNNKIIKGRKTTPQHFFYESSIFNKEIFIQSLWGTKYQNADTDYYHEKLKNWSEGKSIKRSDWLATAKNFMLDDVRDNKYVKKINKQENGYDPEQKAREQIEEINNFDRKSITTTSTGN